MNKNAARGEGLNEIERDYAAIGWRHVPGLLAAIHDELANARIEREKAVARERRRVVIG